ncbi:alpha/beta hydrolase-fold protein [Alteromonas portus]|uniref:alpha/beta hydrolase-fold protein n=1 Tax=Alteromonas portus TaxID=2565549 RepID=UPI003BF90F69
MTKLILTITLLLLACPHSTFAQVRGLNKLDKVYSEVLSEDREILIHLPSSYKLDSKAKYPVMYLTDGLRNFNHAAGTLDLLTQSYKTQEMIIVAIKNTHRTRDYTPTYDGSYNQWGISGGADNFLDFLEKELIPYINNTYRTTEFNVLSGHSLGGLLVIHSLQTRPHLFQAHFAFSPSLWWHDGVILRRAKDFFSQTKTLNNTLYLNLANEDAQMRNAFDEYIQTLEQSQIEGFTFRFDIDEQENHSTIALVGHNKAYVYLFKSLRCPDSIIAKGITDFEQCYKTLSEQYGVDILPSYDVYRQAASASLKNNDFATAIGIFNGAINKFPYTSDAHFRKAYALKEKGDISSALDSINHALEISRKENVENNKYKTFKTNLLVLLDKHGVK